MRPNTYEFNGKVVLRRVTVTPGSMIGSEELRKRLMSGETVSLAIGDKKPRVEVDYEYSGGVFNIDLHVKWI